MSLPTKVKTELADSRYVRKDPNAVEQSLSRLGVRAPESFLEFYGCYEGPFWSRALGIELADLVEDANNIESVTQECRDRFGLPARYLVITALSPGGTIHVVDCEMDEVYVVDFEGGQELLKLGQLKPRWTSFYAFLETYFSPKESIPATF